MYKKFQIESKVKSLRVVEKAIDETTNELGISSDDYGKILVSTLEGVNNAILHGNHSDPEKKVESIRAIYDDLDIRLHAENKAYEYINKAFESLEAVSVQAERKNELKQLTVGLIGRNR